MICLCTKRNVSCKGGDNMIKHLSGDFETVEYESHRSVLLYDNHENEAYPIHWRDAVEIIMPLKNHYLITVGETDYRIEENDVLIIPSGELHSMPEEIPGRRIIFQCDNSVLGDVSAFEPVMRALSAPLMITPETDKELHILAKKTMLDIFALYNSHSELSDVKIYTALINMLMAIREYQLNIMRAVGTPVKRLRRRLTLDSIKIPVFSAVTAYGLMRLLQQLMLHAHDKSELLTTQAADQAAQGNLDRYHELFDKATEIGQRYLVGSQMWYVNALMPTLIVFSVMCIVTILLTRRSFKMFTPNIAYAISKGRKRR